MKYGEAVAKVQDSVPACLPAWVFEVGDYFVAGFLLLLALVLLSSLSALAFGTPSPRQILVRKNVARQADKDGGSDQANC